MEVAIYGEVYKPHNIFTILLIKNKEVRKKTNNHKISKQNFSTLYCIKDLSCAKPGWFMLLLIYYILIVYCHLDQPYVGMRPVIFESCSSLMLDVCQEIKGRFRANVDLLKEGLVGRLSGRVI